VQQLYRLVHPLLALRLQKEPQRLQKQDVPVRLPQDMELLKKVENYDCSRILEEAPKSDFWRTVRYLIKQKEHWYTLQDYRNMARNAGRDMTDNLVQWPRNLTAAHNRYVEERQARWDKEENEKRAKEIAERSVLFAERAVELEWLSFEAGGPLIRPPPREGGASFWSVWGARANPSGFQKANLAILFRFATFFHILNI